MSTSKRTANKRRRKPKKTPELAKVWIYSIMNPILDTLAIEKLQVQNNKWTWMYWSRQFEHLKSVSEMLGDYSMPNLRQFIRLYPNVERCIKDHDSWLLKLNEKVGECFDYIVNNQIFINEFEKAFASFNEGASIEDTQKEENKNTTAIYIVNNADTLPGHYRLYDFWNKYKEQFIILKEKSGFSDKIKQADDKGEKFLKTIINLEKRLADIRIELADKFGISEVPVY